MRHQRRMAGGFVILLVVCGAAVLWPPTAWAGWFPPAKLTTASGEASMASNNATCLAVAPSGNLHLVWCDDRIWDADIMYTSFDGVTWSQDTALVSMSPAAADPAITVDGSGNIHIVWVDWIDGTSELYHIVNDGAGWTAPQSVSGDSTYTQQPAIAHDSEGRVHAVWRGLEGGAWVVFHSVYEGGVWSEREQVSDIGAQPYSPSIAVVDSESIHIVWYDYRHMNYEIFYTGFDGDSWSADLRLTADPGVSENSSIVVDSYGIIHIFWDDNRAGNPGIYHKSFDGISWTSDEYLVAPIGNAYAPHAAAGSGGRLHVVWYDQHGQVLDIYYKEYDGVSWGAEELLTCEESRYPHVALDGGGNPHVVWQDHRQTDYEIFWTARLDSLPEPELVSVSPDSAFSVSEVHITDLSGSGFFFGASVRLEKPGEPDIVASNVILDSDEKITCCFDLWYVASGFWDIVVENVDGQGDTLTAGFSVIPLPAPEVTSIAPNAAPAYEHVYVSDLMGSGFRDETSVVLVRTGYPPVEVINLVPESPTEITFDLTLGCVEPGFWDVVIWNPDTQADTLFSGFEVLPGVWSEDTRLTNAGDLSSTSPPNGSCIDVDEQGKIHVVWYDYRDRNSDIYYKLYNGEVWGPDVCIVDTDVESIWPALALDGAGHPHVVWADQRDGNYEIYHKYHDGSSWSGDERLTNALGDSRNPSIATGPGGHIYIVWRDERGGDPRVYFRMHDGSGWLPEENITPDLRSCGSPAVAVDGFDHVHVVWFSGSQWICYKTFDGTNWSSAETVASTTNPYVPNTGPNIAVDIRNMVHIVWHDRGLGDPYDNEIYYRRFDGLIWSPVESLWAGDDYSYTSSLAVDDSGNVHIAWADRSSGFGDIYCKVCDGEAWGFAIRLTQSDAESKHPSLAVGPDGGLHMVWRDARDAGDENSEIYYKSRDPLHLASVADGEPVGDSTGELRILPNPMERSAKIRFRLAAESDVQLALYDIAGRLVSRSDLGMLGPGAHSVGWNPCPRSGSSVTPGVYFLRLQAGEQRIVRKLVVVR